MKKKILILIFVILLMVIIKLISIKKNSTNDIYIPTENDVVENFEKEEILEKRISLVAVGDALIHGALYSDASNDDGTYDFNHMFTKIKPLIDNYDLKYYNQETIIGGKNLGISHYPRFNSPDEIGENLVDIGFNLVSLANNHSFDKKEAGVLYSVNFWRRQGIVFSGQSDSFEYRNNIEIHELNGVKYAFIAYTDATNGLGLPKGKEYLVNIYSDEQAKKDIESVRDKVDVVIVSMHWGSEYTHKPTLSEKRQAQYLASLDVDLIIGSHPHVIQPVDYIDDTLVVYSLGNFVSGQKSLGLAKIIGLMVGMDIVVKDDDNVVFENLDYKLLYTYSTNKNTNYQVIPFDDLTDDILKDYEAIEKKYMNIVMSDVLYD